MSGATVSGLLWIRDECIGLENNPALQAAAKSCGKLFCCYVLTVEQRKWKNGRTSDKILTNHNLESLDQQLRSEYNTSLIIVEGSLVLDSLRRIAYALGVQCIYFNRKAERGELQLQSTLSSLTGISVESFDREVKNLSFGPVARLRNSWRRLMKSTKRYNITSKRINEIFIPVWHLQSLDVSRRVQALRNHERSKPILIPAKRQIH